MEQRWKEDKDGKKDAKSDKAIIQRYRALHSQESRQFGDVR